MATRLARSCRSWRFHLGRNRNGCGDQLRLGNGSGVGAGHERNARVTKRPQHPLELGIGHESELSVLLFVELAQSRELERLAGVQGVLNMLNEAFHGLNRVGVKGPVLGHQFVGQHAVVGGQPRVEQDVA